MTDHRITQLPGEVVHDPAPPHRMTQVVGEVVHDQQPPHRMTQVCAEVVYENTTTATSGPRAWFASF